MSLENFIQSIKESIAVPSPERVEEFLVRKFGEEYRKKIKIYLEEDMGDNYVNIDNPTLINFLTDFKWWLENKSSHYEAKVRKI